VTSGGSVTGDERLRLFLAFQLPDDVVATIVDWQARELRGRTVPADHLHVTLAFLGSRPASELPSILGALEHAARLAVPPVLELVRWRETRAAGVLELADPTGRGVELAGRLHEQLEALGVYRRETRPWWPHVTVLRYRQRPRLAPALPQLAPFAPSDAAAFLSCLHTTGARYEVLEQFRLGG
jgi:2'-5' RNA ligase